MRLSSNKMRFFTLTPRVLLMFTAQGQYRTAVPYLFSKRHETETTQTKHLQALSMPRHDTQNKQRRLVSRGGGTTKVRRRLTLRAMAVSALTCWFSTTCSHEVVARVCRAPASANEHQPNLIFHQGRIHACLYGSRDKEDLLVEVLQVPSSLSHLLHKVHLKTSGNQTPYYRGDSCSETQTAIALLRPNPRDPPHHLD